ncbi:MAG: hypothetical protein M3372_06755, partial [Verrucomicrobiota bacterium]|nr:hypothetical protein [Verrucomicrobiota bacterium]
MTRLLVDGRDPCAFSRSTNFASLRRVLNSGPYTAIVRGADDTTGIALVEAYDRNAGNGAQLANISTRGVVERDENVLIGGFIVSSEGRGSRVLVRAIGPSTKSQVPDALDNPELELFHRNGTAVGYNDNWKDSPRRSEIENSGVAPTNDVESAVLLDVTPAPYTAIVRGVNDT